MVTITIEESVTEKHNGFKFSNTPAPGATEQEMILAGNMLALTIKYLDATVKNSGLKADTVFWTKDAPKDE